MKGWTLNFIPSNFSYNSSNRDIFSNSYFSKFRYDRARTEVKRKNAGRAGREGGREKKICILPPPLFPFPLIFSFDLSSAFVGPYLLLQKPHTNNTKNAFYAGSCFHYTGGKLDKSGLQFIRAAKNIVSCLGDFTKGFVASGFHSFVIYHCSSQI